MFRKVVPILPVVILITLQTSLRAQVVEKVADLNFVSQDGVGVGGYDACDRFTQVGTNLWFTTAKGGTFDAGTISRFDLVTREVVQVASLDNNTGKSPEGALLVVDNEAYFTTLNGGAGNRGTIAKVHLDSGIVTTVYDFPTNSSFGQSPRGALNRIGNDLWTTTSGGGASGRGTLVKVSLTDGAATLVASFDGPLLGGQPYEGLTQAGDAWYFTTFTGGETFGTTGLSLGAGTLGRLTFDSNSTPVLTRLLSLQGGYTQFPAQNPVLVGTNSLYFTTVGPNTNPGAIVRYDLDTGTSSNLFLFNTNLFDPVLYGKQPGYNGLTEWNGDLYFMTRQGGISNLGVIAKFNIASNTLTKLADLRGNGADSLGSGAISYGTGCIVEETNRFYIYYPLARGGANSRGTIIRVALPPPPIALSVAPSEGNTLQLAWTGGYPPFTVEKTDNLSASQWSTLSTGITNRNVVVPRTNGTSFFRIVGSL